MSIVGFWKPDQPDGYLSQWYYAPMTINGQRYSCAEQYYMVAKAVAFNDLDTALKVLATPRPQEMKNLGKQIKGFDENKWNTMKYGIVVNGNRAKFTQHPELLEKLRQTGGATLVELSPYDTVWGVGTTSPNPEHWRGQNLLGKALMQIRHEGRKWEIEGILCSS